MDKCSKGESCSFSHDEIAQGDLCSDQRQQGPSSSPAPNSKGKTDERREKSSKTAPEGSSTDRRSQIPCRCGNCNNPSCSSRMSKLASLGLDAHMAKHADSDMLRLRRSPAKSRKKEVLKGQLP